MPFTRASKIKISSNKCDEGSEIFIHSNYKSLKEEIKEVTR
jgi:hypothetical protein